MKTLLTLFTLVISSILFGQSATNGSDLPEQNFNFMLDDGRFVNRDLIGAGKGKEIQWKVTDPMTGKTETYTTPFEMDGHPLDRKIHGQLSGNYIYEFYTYPSDERRIPSITDPHLIGMVKRNVKDGFKAEGELTTITTFDLHREREYIYSNDDYFYILVRNYPAADLGQMGLKKPGTKDLPVRHFLIRSDFKMEDKHTVQTPFMEDERISIPEGKVDDMNNLIMRIAVTENMQVNHALIIFGEDETPALLAPQIDESFTFNAYELYFDNKTDELVGIYSIIEKPDKDSGKEGYKYYRWNMAGEIVKSEKYFFTYDDILTDELKAHLKREEVAIEVNTSDPIPSLDQYSGGAPDIHPLPDGGCLLSFRSFTANSSKYTKFFTKNLGGNGYNFAIGPDGKLQWTKVYSKAVNGMDTPTEYFDYDGQIVGTVVSQDCYFNGGNFNYTPDCDTKPNERTNRHVIELVDRNTGATNRVIAYGDPERWSYLKWRDVRFLDEDGAVLVEFRNTRRNSMFYSRINLQD